jgi:hypothetical protein
MLSLKPSKRLAEDTGGQTVKPFKALLQQATKAKARPVGSMMYPADLLAGKKTWELCGMLHAAQILAEDAQSAAYAWCDMSGETLKHASAFVELLRDDVIAIRAELLFRGFSMAAV